MRFPNGKIIALQACHVDLWKCVTCREAMFGVLWLRVSEVQLRGPLPGPPSSPLPQTLPLRASLGPSAPQKFKWVFRYAGDHHGANQNSGREISSPGPEMCTNRLWSETTRTKHTMDSRSGRRCPLFLRPWATTCWARKTNSRSSHPRSKRALDSKAPEGLQTLWTSKLGSAPRVPPSRCS